MLKINCWTNHSSLYSVNVIIVLEKNIIEISLNKTTLFLLSCIPYKWGESLLTSMGILDLLFYIIPHHIQRRKAFPAKLNLSVKWILMATLNTCKEKHSRSIGHFYWRSITFSSYATWEREWKDVIYYLVGKIRKGKNQKKSIVSESCCGVSIASAAYWFYPYSLFLIIICTKFNVPFDHLVTKYFETL